MKNKENIKKMKELKTEIESFAEKYSMPGYDEI